MEKPKTPLEILNKIPTYHEYNFREKLNMEFKNNGYLTFKVSMKCSYEKASQLPSAIRSGRLTVADAVTIQIGRAHV